MGTGNSHGPPAGHAGGRYRARLAAAFVLVAAFFVVELVAGVLSGSLALLSDAGHMAADVVALGAALVATKIAPRPDSTGRRTYGSYRAEVFASGLTVLIMLGVATYVVVEVIGRINGEPEVALSTMLGVGVIGLAISLASAVAPFVGAALADLLGSYSDAFLWLAQNRHMLQAWLLQDHLN